MRLYGVDKTPKFLPMPPVAVLHRLSFYPASKFSRVNRLDVSENGTYFRLEAPPGEPQLRQAVGVFPRLVLRPCEGWGGGGACGRGGAAAGAEAY